MQVIKTGLVELKKVKCWKCKAELAYSTEDVRINSGYWFVRCPICGGNIFVDEPERKEKQDGE